jgi:subtilisin family serine protease
MDQKHHLILLLCLVVVAACDSDAKPAPEPGELDRGSAALDAMPLTLPGCDPSRLVGLTRNSCPAATGQWQGRKLFPGTSNVVDANGYTYCRYQWQGDPQSVSFAGLPRDPVHGGLASTWLVSDCPVVVALGEGQAETALRSVAEAYHQGYRAQLGRADKLPVLRNSLGIARRPQPTLVSVLDTAEDGPIDAEREGDAHGRLVGSIISDLSCPRSQGSGCASTVQGTKVLSPDPRDQARSVRSVAYVAELAAEIIALMQRTSGNVVLNLSIGYPASYAELVGGGAGGYHTATQALMAALDYATCHGALVIAAAGNSTDGPMLEASENEPMYPAAFTQLTTWSCSARPLLHAAGGVMPDDAPLVNERPGSRPELVAPSYLVTQHVKNTQVSALGLQTGTSFGAAAVSAAAALVWSYLPELDAEGVMARVRQAALTLPGLEADFCPYGAACARVGRISMCSTLQRTLVEVCARPEFAASCSSMPALSCQTPQASRGAYVSAPVGKILSMAQPVDVQWQALKGTACAGDRVYGTRTATALSAMCASDNFPNALDAPFELGTQPAGEGCRSCGVYKPIGAGDPDKLIIGLKPGYLVSALNGLTLVDDAGGTYAIGAEAALAQGDGLIAIPLKSKIKGKTAVLTHKLDGADTSVTSHIPIWDDAP